jgi:hypothetical protein
MRSNHDRLKGQAVRIGHVSSAALMLSGIAAVVAPRRVATALQLSSVSNRGSAETRAGLGGTYAALGAVALASRDPAFQAAVGVTWLGAAAVRLAALVLDRPQTDTAYWAYLAAEIGFGAAALADTTKRPRCS